MLGAIIGDMVGSPYEFHPWQGAAEAFPLFSPCSRFTDDTVMTVAVARGLMQAYGQEQACREASRACRLMRVVSELLRKATRNITRKVAR